MTVSYWIAVHWLVADTFAARTTSDVSGLTVGFSAAATFALLMQLPAAALLLARLLRGPFRRAPLVPAAPAPDLLGSVSAVVPTLNEAARLQPCLEGLSRQSYELREVLVVDSRSEDGTPELVERAATRDPRFRVMTDDPLPQGWVGRPWALHSGFSAMAAQSEWFLGLDADTQPQPGLVASLVRAAIADNLDAVSLSPQFILKYPGEVWLQPALLMTLVYRFGPAGEFNATAERIMANGQCFLCRQSLLEGVGGFASARDSFCDDVTLVRHLAASGARVGFLDGAKVLKVRMYEGATETWREWGRSLDLKDASSPAQTYGDLWFLAAVQGLPLPLMLFFYGCGANTPMVLGALGTNVALVAIRVALLWAIAPSYDLSKAEQRWLFWLSPLADSLAVLRIGLSALQRPTQWRGRIYSHR
ncbi:2'-O-glycosyltransferase CruG [Altericista sp. CCNU0014]|uniref:2'-O-glycosyltransferase CruG n=1 Tax=Altericista sp. CCNU0014 TaxID=3082949 RepID=UPI00384AB686